MSEKSFPSTRIEGEIYEKIIILWFIGIIKSRSNKICDDEKAREVGGRGISFFAAIICIEIKLFY